MTPPRLLLLTPAEGPLGELVETLEPLAGEAEVAVLLRRPAANERQLLAEAATLRATGVPLLMHRRPDLALLVGAVGVHLPERGLPIAEARRLLGPDRLIGVSRHDAEGLAGAVGADYATLSPFAAVAGKNPPLGPAAFGRMRRSAPPATRVLALGGLSPANVAEAMGAGADGVAVLRGATQARTLLDMVGARGG